MKRNRIFIYYFTNFYHRDFFFELIMFSRWGETLYHSTDLENHGWDGTYHGKPVPEWVYLYVIKARDKKGRSYKYSGNVTLLR